MTVEVWIDGCWEPTNPGGTACTGYVMRKDGEIVAMAYGYVGKGEGMTNNVAEYNALIRALKRIWKEKLQHEKILVRSDSKLVVNQMNGIFKVHAPLIIPLYRKAKLNAFGLDIRFEWVPREENEEADALTHKAYRKSLEYG
jgi:ribonuclease HI